MEPNTSGVFPGKSPSLYCHSDDKDNTSAAVSYSYDKAANSSLFATLSVSCVVEDLLP